MQNGQPTASVLAPLACTSAKRLLLMPSVPGSSSFHAAVRIQQRYAVGIRAKARAGLADVIGRHQLQFFGAQFGGCVFQQVFAKHQHEHGEHEQVEIQEELGKLWVAVHVANCIQMDERADAGDEQRHGDGQRVGQERQVDMQRADWHPFEQGDNRGALFGWAREQVEVDHDGDEERGNGHCACQATVPAGVNSTTLLP